MLGIRSALHVVAPRTVDARAQRALLRAVDAAVGVDRPVALTGSARDRVTVPYEALVEIRTCIAEVMGVLPSGSPA